MAIIEIKKWIVWYVLALGDAWALLTGSSTEAKKEYTNISQDAQRHQRHEGPRRVGRHCSRDFSLCNLLVYPLGFPVVARCYAV
jgi:hypothetical protein